VIKIISNSSIMQVREYGPMVPSLGEKGHGKKVKNYDHYTKWRRHNNKSGLEDAYLY